MSASASFVKVSSDPKSPDSFRNAQNTLRDYFNKVVRKAIFLEERKIEEDDYDEADNSHDFAENLRNDFDDIVMTRIPLNQVEFAIKTWKGMERNTPIVHNEISGYAYTAEECIQFFEYCLKEMVGCGDSYFIYLIWEQ
jgi:hypothetical protein